VLALVAIAGCGGSDSSTGTLPADLSGSYTLRTYKGVPLPVLIAASGGNTKTLLDDAYTLTADSKFTELWHVENFQSGVKTTLTVGDTGVYVRVGGSIQLTGLAGPNATLTAVIRGDTLKVTDQSGTLVYVKERFVLARRALWQ
jgi:hypothetical protein